MRSCASHARMNVSDVMSSAIIASPDRNNANRRTAGAYFWYKSWKSVIRPATLVYGFVAQRLQRIMDSFFKVCYRIFQIHMNSSAQELQRRSSIAPAWHTFCLLAILAIFSVFSAYVRMGSPAPRLRHLLLFPVIIAFEWTTFLFALWRSNRTFADYLLAQLGILAPSSWMFRLRCCSLPSRFCSRQSWSASWGQTGWASLEGMRPHSALEIALWIAMALSAGICEEVVFCGYLQQFSAWTESVSVGTFAQAACFGLVHAYQAWKNIALIFVLGCVLGVFAVWRKNLRANMIAHALVDIVSAF
jgi:uncharacterized protein